MKHGFWNLSLYALGPAHHSDKTQPEWKKIVSLGQETINTPLYTQLDTDHIFLVTEFLTSFVLIGESFNGKAVKNLKLAVYAPPFSCTTTNDYCLRVYVLEDTPCALFFCTEQEKRLGGRLMDRPKSLLFQDGGSNLCLSLEDIGLGWRVRPGSSFQEIPFKHLWNSQTNSLYCSFSLEQTESIHHLQCQISAFQSTNPSHKQTLFISSSDDVKINSPFSSKRHFVYDDYNLNVIEKFDDTSLLPKQECSIYENTCLSEGFSSQKNLAVNEKGINTCIVDNVIPFRLSKTVKRQLSALLDPPNSHGNDWRLLAKQLNVDRYINFFAIKKSPTENILDLWECRNRSARAAADLGTLLRSIGRDDAASVLESCLGPNWL